MSVTIIGVDPHKRSHTAVVLDECEEVKTQIRVAAAAGQVDALLAWAPTTQRLWAVENANGLGRLLAQQLVTRGETVVDVPAPLACRARKLSGRSGRKTDEFDARAVAIAARHTAACARSASMTRPRYWRCCWNDVGSSSRNASGCCVSCTRC